METRPLSTYQILIQRKSLWILYDILGLTTTDSSEFLTLFDAVIVSIDFENVTEIRMGLSQNTNCQVGIAILDTKELRYHLDQTPISTFNYATGSAAYIAKASRRFLFGKSTPASSILDCIKSCIPHNRNIVLVGYGLSSDLQAMRSLGFQFLEGEFTAIDIFRLANEVFGKWSGSLGDLLSRLECPHFGLHCAGNDANFTLQALLLLTAQGFINKQQQQQHQHKHQQLQQQKNKTLSIIQKLATDQIPDRAIATTKALQKQEKRAMEREMRRKSQSKLRTLEQQQMLRAKRKQTRLDNENLEISIELFDIQI
ncbi:hypothetical protein CIB48_g1928 [Xylaria polymorpha]|nr:hypothetical protein CIB48_g1928 [Xylaria polymorpha]